MTYGGIITSLKVRDRQGEPDDVVLGHGSVEPYLRNASYIGAIIGRYANRIANGRFVLDGREYQIATNDAPNHLHGGRKGFDQQHWAAAPLVTPEGPAVRFSRTSAAGEEEYPGTLNCSVTYVLIAPGSVELRYEARTDAPTIINLTQHTYFNLGGERSTNVLDHELTIHASYYTPVDRTLIPTGEVAGVDDTPFDFRRPAVLRRALGTAHPQLGIAGGFDHNFIVDRSSPGLVHAATLHDPRSGRTLRVSTTEPGLQFYDGHLLDSAATDLGGRVFRRYEGLCLETQHYPDSPHHPHFPTVELRPGERYGSTTRWEFPIE